MPGKQADKRHNVGKRTFKKSESLLARAEKSIPLGAQTFSKSRTQYPLGVSPYFITRGQGSHVWDADGNEYVDFINGLAAVTLGYNDPDVNRAVTAQMQEGVIFSLSHPIEMQVAEKIIEMVPCAEKVRFGKNGSDATAGAVRVARAFTGRDHILVCGYHGWQDWYIGSTARNLGVPQAVRDLTHSFPYNDIDALNALFTHYKGQVAAVVMEPMNVAWPKDGYLAAVRELTHKHGALLVFDEMITGFRYANGGAQEFFGVTPDLAAFGKGLANGYPLSAVAGRDDVMKTMEEIFFSFTFGGETLSLAAALATLTKLQREPVIKTLDKTGEEVMAEVAKLIDHHGVGETFSLSGHPSWSFLMVKDTGGYDSFTIKSFFMQEMFQQGVLAYGTHNISYAHTDEDIAQLVYAYDHFFGAVKRGFEGKNLQDMLACEPIRPLFKVR